MSLLTDTSLEKLLITDRAKWTRGKRTKKEKLLIENFEESSLTPLGYDLRVGEQYLKMCGKIREFSRLQKDGELTILPNEIVAIETEEFIGMPQSKKYSGILVSKVSVAEKGLSHISTSLDPDYQGKLIITVDNYSGREITLKRGQPFCTVIFIENKSPATRDCRKHPSEHIRSLIEDWKLIEERRRRMLYLWIPKISIPAIPLVWILWRYLVATISEAEVAMFVAVSTFLFLVLDKILSTE